MKEVNTAALLLPVTRVFYDVDSLLWYKILILQEKITSQSAHVFIDYFFTVMSYNSVTLSERYPTMQYAQMVYVTSLGIVK